MATYAYKDDRRKDIIYAASAVKEDRNKKFYCPNPNCTAHLYICAVDGSKKAYFRATKKEFPHVPMCPFGSSTDEYDSHRSRRRMVMVKGTKYSQQFKEDAVQYRLEHPELPLRKAAENLGVSESALKNWMKAAKEHKGEVPTRGSGNYASEEAKEIARLQRELRDTKDALEVLKKQSVFWETDKSSLHGYF